MEKERQRGGREGWCEWERGKGRERGREGEREGGREGEKVGGREERIYT